MLVVSATLNVAGAVLFVAFLPPAPAGFRGGEPAGLLGALAAPGIRTMALASVPVGFCLGTIEVGLPAFSSSHGSPELAGVLLAIWSLGSAAGGFIYGARQRHRTLLDMHTRLAFLLPLATIPLLLATQPPLMALLVLFAGAPLAPLIATRNELVSHIAPGAPSPRPSPGRSPPSSEGCPWGWRWRASWSTPAAGPRRSGPGLALRPSARCSSSPVAARSPRRHRRRSV